MLRIMILWTWGLTPLWVNVVGTVLISLELICRFIKALVKN